MCEHQLTQEDLEFDKKHIWHPYTSITTPLKVYPVTKAEGSYLYLDNGTKVVDGMASWWCVQQGYNNHRLNAAAISQINKMSHVMFGGITHKAGIDFCKKLLALLPDTLECALLADSGFLTIKKGYHGDAFGAVSVCDPVNSRHNTYNGFLAENIFCKAPEVRFDCREKDVEKLVEELDVKPFAEIIDKHHSEISGVVMESIVQGAGGLRMYHPYFLKRVRALCNDFNILLILDEVAVGLGRTGMLFGFEHAGIVPDIVCLGKTLTAGYLTLSATVTTREIGDQISSGPEGCFMHGQTYMANPLACAVASENLSILMEGKWKSQVRQIEVQLKKELVPLLEHPIVADVRILGAIGVVEVTKRVNVEVLQEQFIKAGAWIRPFGNIIYILPPYIITSEELTVLTEAIRSVLDFI
ncbi:CGH_1_collapsed_G0026050.mRNA.1.CDS.1 [Saccharomyces cerevisiae]|nr:CGH_1_HP_G0057520.mRNA.1.CDS.1 [Saccharomyces cerevisiae]CAI4982365.1 CGH_1_HP_G0060530.mRNA.1.CDS.1 [Saccharomyces cerevisiae]CAI6804388.1 CGH_1_HP_G0057520.mRNA.1.CDS.1 [Saccharomyces cerevisiae]CAI6828073.1 CGH_1_HP_G0060530.mRNA.1.CDS.1 [Saccharomyces cerevisiae]CAI7123470.1 CMF_collapsed_G0000120.mRNA.1.CDS.1 [Saccharomyces cerevisiae]